MDNLTVELNKRVNSNRAIIITIIRFYREIRKRIEDIDGLK